MIGTQTIRELGAMTARPLTVGFIGLLMGLAADDHSAEEKRDAAGVSERTVSMITDRLQSTGERRVRSLAAQALGEFGGTQSVTALRELLNDDSVDVQLDALRALSQLLAAEEFAGLLRQSIEDGAKGVAGEAIALIAQLPQDEAHKLLLAIDTKVTSDLRVRWAQVAFHHRLNTPSDRLGELLAAERTEVRLWGVRLLASQPDDVDRKVRLELLNDRHPMIRAAAFSGLTDADRQIDEVLNAARSRLTDPNSLVRRSALRWLSGTFASLTELEPYLQDDDPMVRREAVRAVGLLPADMVTERIAGMFGDSERLVAIAASDQLAKLEHATVGPVVLFIAESENDQVAEMAARTLGAIRWKEALPVLQNLAGRRALLVRIAAYEALGTTADGSIVPWLLQRVPAEDGFARAAVNRALGHLGDSRAARHLAGDLHYPDQPTAGNPERRSRGLDSNRFQPGAAMPGPYLPQENAVAIAALISLRQIGDFSALADMVEMAADVLRDPEFRLELVTTFVESKDESVYRALVEFGALGSIRQGLQTVLVSDEVRIKALDGLGQLGATVTVDDILQMDSNSSREVRQKGAEVLEALSGKSYRAMLPQSTRRLFLQEIPRESSNDEGRSIFVESSSAE